MVGWLTRYSVPVSKSAGAPELQTSAGAAQARITGPRRPPPIILAWIVASLRGTMRHLAQPAGVADRRVARLGWSTSELATSTRAHLFCSAYRFPSDRNRMLVRWSAAPRQRHLSADSEIARCARTATGRPHATAPFSSCTGNLHRQEPRCSTTSARQAPNFRAIRATGVEQEIEIDYAALACNSVRPCTTSSSAYLEAPARIALGSLSVSAHGNAPSQVSSSDSQSFGLLAEGRGSEPAPLHRGRPRSGSTAASTRALTFVGRHRPARRAGRAGVRRRDTRMAP